MPAVAGETQNGQTHKRQTKQRRIGRVQEKKYPALAARYNQRVYWHDEMRFGTRTALKRRWTPRGHRPQCRVKIAYEFGYLYAAICPFTGSLFALLLPSMKKECFAIFAHQFCQWLGQQQEEESKETLMILDGAGSHQSSVVSANSQLHLQKLPPACPELNPVERFFQELRRELSNQVFETITAVEQRIQQLLEKYWDEPKLLIRLTSFPYISTSYLV